MTSLSYRARAFAFGLVERIEPLAVIANKWVINRTVNRARARPHPLSTQHDYVSWSGLTDRTWSGRHLPPQSRQNAPDVDTVMDVFRRPDGQQRLCPKSTCLFPAFAQYLTDGFIRTESEGLTPDAANPADRLARNTSNHEIDLCTLYGRTPAQTHALRLKSDDRSGRLKTQTIDGEDFSPFLYRDGAVDPQFTVLDPPLGAEKTTPERRAKLFACGGDRVNSVPQVVMINTLFLREHNRLADQIASAHPDWDDTRVFETARNTNIVLFIKIVVEDYINHISPMPFHLRADPSVAWTAPWNKPNWITTEFSLLYRWHALIPDSIRWGDTVHPVRQTFMNNDLLIARGLSGAFADMSDQPAGELGPRNTADALLHVEHASVTQDRHCRLASYSDYCAYLGQPRPVKFTDISSDPEVASRLAQLYDHPREVDFHVGLFCEDRVPNAPLPGLVLMFVALDAFSQALTNPLLSRHVFREETFSSVGWTAIKQTRTLADVVKRNVAHPEKLDRIAMTRADWQPV